jgi:hypothetical protein
MDVDGAVFGVGIYCCAFNGYMISVGTVGWCKQLKFDLGFISSDMYPDYDYFVGYFFIELDNASATTLAKDSIKCFCSLSVLSLDAMAKTPRVPLCTFNGI